MTDNNFLFTPSWQCFIKMRLIYLLGLLCLIFLYYQLLSASINNLQVYSLFIFSFNSQMNEIILISLLISIISFFIYYTCSIHCVNSNKAKFYIIFSFFTTFLLFLLLFFQPSNFFLIGNTLLSLSLLNFLSFFFWFCGS